MTPDEFIAERTRERDRFELDLSDTIDVKASFVLVILTFLGTIATTVLTADKLDKIANLAQIPVIVFVIISGIFCVACLWPKKYLVDDVPERYTDWLASLGQSEPDQLATVAALSVKLANARIKRNQALNLAKTWYLNGSFWSMSAALLAELIAVAYIAFAIRPS